LLGVIFDEELIDVTEVIVELVVVKNFGCVKKNIQEHNQQIWK
jgi:hypothetical protein